MIQITDVVKKLLIVNVAVYFLTTAVFPQYRNILIFNSPATGDFQPIQIITHLFMHGSVQHLLFNMMGLFFFGPRLELTWGPKKFLFYYFLCGLGSIGLYYVYEIFIAGKMAFGLLGASGAINGLLMGFAMLFPNERIALLFPPISGKAKYFVFGILIIEIIIGLSGMNTGVAHLGHVGGALMGFAIALFWKQRKQLYESW